MCFIFNVQSTISHFKMVTTVFDNATDIEFNLKEGNAGVYTNIAKLLPNKQNKHNVDIDPNATYREYVVATGVEGQKVFVTSDDCADNEKITIVKNGDGFDMEVVARDTNRRTPDQRMKRFFLIDFFLGIWNRFILRKDTTK